MIKRVYYQYWKDFESWERFGYDNNYDERKATNLTDSDAKEERSWYRRGKYMGWLKDFPFACRSPYLKLDGWKKHGLENEFDKRGGRSLRKSGNIDERSWYQRGEYKDWLDQFPFKRKRRKSRILHNSLLLL